MTAAKLLRLMGAIDAVTGVTSLVLATWLAEQVDVGVTPVRIAAGLLLVLGIETFLLAERPVRAKATMAIEAACALLAIDLALVGDPTSAGMALLLGTAVLCAAFVVELALLQRARAVPNVAM